MSAHKQFNKAKVKVIGYTIGIDWDNVDIKEFTMGLTVELEHGSHDPETNVIDDNEEMAGKNSLSAFEENS
jgi:hypothetical protein